VSDTNPDGTTPVPPVPSAPPGYAYPETPAPGQAYPSPPAYESAPPAYGTAAVYGAAPPYGAAPYGSYAPAKTNTLAIVSLISSLVGLFLIPFLGSLAGVITGHMSLGQIKRTGEQGRGLALAGTITGYVGLAFTLLGILAFLAFLPLIFASVNTSV
jgi:hypothetical protein